MSFELNYLEIYTYVGGGIGAVKPEVLTYLEQMGRDQAQIYIDQVEITFFDEKAERLNQL